MLELKSRPPDEPGDGVRTCTLRGEIGSSGMLRDILAFLAHAAWWGELVVEEGTTRRSLYFDERHIVAAQSTAESERLGAVLVRCGVLTDEQAEACAERAVDRDLRFGEALVELGFIQRAKLFSLMGRQVQEIFGGVAALESGQFYFFAGFDDARLSFRQKHSVDALLRDAVAEPDESLGVAEIAPTSAHSRRGQTGHAKSRRPRVEARETISVYNSSIVAILSELDEIGRGDEVRRELARFDGAAGAGPSWASAYRADDGTLDVEAMIAKIEGASDPVAAEDQLGRWFYDYASYAVFLAQPHLERRDAARPGVCGLAVLVRADRTPIADIGAAAAAPKPGHAGATVRMRRSSTALLPGVDPSRTVRMMKVSVEALLRAQAAGTVPARPRR
jgi:hypothetical protein